MNSDIDKKYLNYAISNLQKNPYLLQHIDDQTLEMCMIAIRKDFTALWYVKNKTFEIYLFAIKKDIRALKFIDAHISSDVFMQLCIIGIDYNNLDVKNVHFAYYCELFDKERLSKDQIDRLRDMVCIRWRMPKNKKIINYFEMKPNDFIEMKIKEYDDFAIRNLHKDINLFRFIHTQTMEVCLYAVKKDHTLFEHVKIEQTPELCIMAISKDYKYLKYVKIERTLEMYKVAVTNSFLALSLIDSSISVNDYMTLCVLAIELHEFHDLNLIDNNRLSKEQIIQLKQLADICRCMNEKIRSTFKYRLKTWFKNN